MTRVLAVATICLLLASCGGAVEVPRSEDGRFDFDAMLEELRDCDALSATFVSVVREAAEEIDRMAEAANGRLPAAELADRVDAIVDTAYFEVAERLGCGAVSHRLDTIERLRRLSPDSESGDELVDEVIRRLKDGPAQASG